MTSKDLHFERLRQLQRNGNDLTAEVATPSHCLTVSQLEGETLSSTTDFSISTIVRGISSGEVSISGELRVGAVVREGDRSVQVTISPAAYRKESYPKNESWLSLFEDDGIKIEGFSVESLKAASGMDWADLLSSPPALLVYATALRRVCDSERGLLPYWKRSHADAEVYRGLILMELKKNLTARPKPI